MKTPAETAIARLCIKHGVFTWDELRDEFERAEVLTHALADETVIGGFGKELDKKLKEVQIRRRKMLADYMIEGKWLPDNAPDEGKEKV